jgi:Na+/H+-dicarboxylate symporter
LLALLAGLFLGALAGASGSTDLASAVRLVEPLGTIWTNAIRMTVVPLVVALVVTGVAGAASTGLIGRLGKQMLPIFFIMLLAGGLLALLLGGPIMSGLSIPADVAAALRDTALAQQTTSPPAAMPSIAQRIIDIVPVNPIKAAADGAMLPLVVFALLFAVALTRLEQVHREPVVSFFRALSEAMMVLVGWVLAVAPIGIFALALGLGLRMGASAAGAILYYVAALSAVLIIYVLLLYPAVRLMCGVPIKRFVAAAAPAQGIAIGSRSSLAALPAVIAGAREHLNAPAHVTGFALPLAVSVFRPNVPLAWVIGVLFLGKLYGVDVDFIDVINVIVVATFISFSVPGVPSASLLLISPLLASLGLPEAGVGILIAVDAIPDMFKTTLNVTSHAAVAACLTGKDGGGQSEPPPAASAQAKNMAA